MFSGFYGSFFQEWLSFYILRSQIVFACSDTMQEHCLTIFSHLSIPKSVTLKVVHFYQNNRERVGLKLSEAKQNKTSFSKL
jgi:hypothetical protein